MIDRVAIEELNRLERELYRAVREFKTANGNLKRFARETIYNLKTKYVEQAKKADWSMPFSFSRYETTHGAYPRDLKEMNNRDGC